MAAELVYLDNNATTMVAPEVLEAMLPYFGERWGNPSSMSAFGGRVARDLDDARERVAAMINASPSEIIFTGCGTESNNMAVYGLAEFLGPEAPILVSKVEHPSVLAPARHFRDDHGYRLVEILVTENGLLDLDMLGKELRRGPALVSLMWANNETGVLFQMEEIAQKVRAAGGILHSDAVQAAGKVPIDVRKVPVDLLSIAGHKMHAPKGIGILYVRRGTRMKNFMLGGHQENGRRGGTENVPYIMGMAKACDMAREHLAEMGEVAALRDRLERGILATCADSSVNGGGAPRVPNTSNISFSYIEGESILYHLGDFGIAASSGSACASGTLEPSHVIRAMGVPFTAAHGSIRFSLSRYSKESEVDYLLSKIPGVVDKLRAMSPFV